LAGPLRSPYREEIDIGRVEIRPAVLGPAGTFSLAVDATGLEGSAYIGHVVATNVAAGTEAGRALVYVIVP
jgi:hypothetical protein